MTGRPLTETAAVNTKWMPNIHYAANVIVMYSDVFILGRVVLYDNDFIVCGNALCLLERSCCIVLYFIVSFLNFIYTCGLQQICPWDCL